MHRSDVRTSHCSESNVLFLSCFALCSLSALDSLPVVVEVLLNVVMVRGKDVLLAVEDDLSKLIPALLRCVQLKGRLDVVLCLSSSSVP